MYIDYLQICNPNPKEPFITTNEGFRSVRSSGFKRFLSYLLLLMLSKAKSYPPSREGG